MNQKNNQSPFQGFHPPTSNTTYTPNQFFDVCLPHYSRGVSRLVGYMLRKTLGWCDENGKPQHEQIYISYNELIKNAGISRDMIRQAIDVALVANFIICIRKGHPSKIGQSAITALYELKWDHNKEYIKSPKKFNGFFAGQGNRTYIPNEFFDVTLRKEPLRLMKLVGAIIRHTIGFQNTYGFRRKNIQMSYKKLERYTCLTSKPLTTALKEAIRNRYIKRVTEGCFDKNAGGNSQAAIYSINWLDSNIFEATSQKSLADTNIHQSEKSSGKSGQKNLVGNKKVRSEKSSGTSQKNLVENQSEKSSDSYKEIKPLNKTFKQQHKNSNKVVVAYQNLMNMGFTENSTLNVINFHPKEKILDIVTNQIKWIKKRNIKQNKLGMLFKAIKENWNEPIDNQINELEKTNGDIFVKYFYASYGGNSGDPIVEPTEKEKYTAERYVQKLLKIYPNNKIEKWGRSFGEFTKKKHNNKNAYASVLAALRAFGDEFFVQQQRVFKAHKEKKNKEKREDHQRKFKEKWIEYLKEEEETFKIRQFKNYEDFLNQRAEQRKEVINGPFASSSKAWLTEFDSEKERIFNFQQYFSGTILDFWSWDKIYNNQKLSISKIEEKEGK